MKRSAGFADANGISLAYETLGDEADPPLLLIMGLGTQMISWPDELCELLAGRGRYLIRFDNRDAGLSTHLARLPAPSPVRSFLARDRPPYRIEDMADDTAGLLVALGIESAHVVGASMGGFIAQSLAIQHVHTVRSLSLIMTSTGARWVGLPKARTLSRLGRRRTVVDRNSAIEAVVDTFRTIGSPGYPFEEAFVRTMAARAFDRSFDPSGYLRQLAAVTAQTDRSRELRRLAVPAVVLHGLDDPLVGVSGGLALARAIPGARFEGFPGMGHDLPRPLWPLFADAIDKVVAAGEATRLTTR